MAKYELPHGKGKIPVKVDKENLLVVLSPIRTSPGSSGTDEVIRALNNPIASRRLKEIVQPGERICIITSDITRPMPSHLVLPLVLDELVLAGIQPKDIVIVFALGSHRKHTEAEMRQLVGDSIFERIKCIDHDPSMCLHLGTTSQGTPVDIFEKVVRADRRICLGNIEFHYFAGYSGGAKAIMPGVTSRSAIQINHSRMVQSSAAAGRIIGNPVRQDIDEIGNFVTIDFILNVVLDEQKRIIKAFAGHYLQAYREACTFLDTLYKRRIPSRADIVLVSAGGYPKDINLYQAQKALDNAKHAVKKGGIIILVAKCQEGLGESVFEEWITKSETPESMITRIQQDFQLGGHKAAAMALVLREAEVFLVSDLPADFVRSIFLRPFTYVQEALDYALTKQGPNAQVIIIPHGGSILPVIE